PNRLLCTREQLAAHLFDEGIKTAPAPRAPDALFVRTPRANLFGARAWREGLFEPQDEGSQLLGHLVEAQPGETVLDLCAGAGGKSLLLAAQGARVLAHDVDLERLDRLRTRAGRTHAPVDGTDGFFAAVWDRIRPEAPCAMRRSRSTIRSLLFVTSSAISRPVPLRANRRHPRVRRAP